jgi:hypothetical protein
MSGTSVPVHEGRGCPVNTGTGHRPYKGVPVPLLPSPRFPVPPTGSPCEGPQSRCSRAVGEADGVSYPLAAVENRRVRAVLRDGAECPVVHARWEAGGKPSR